MVFAIISRLLMCGATGPGRNARRVRERRPRMVAPRVSKGTLAILISAVIQTSPTIRPVLDPEFIPAVLWNRAYRAKVQAGGRGDLRLQRGGGRRYRAG